MNNATNSPATGAPSLSGGTALGQTVSVSTAGIADAQGLDNVTYTYAWSRVDPTYDTSEGVPHVEETSYTLTLADVGHQIRVDVSFTDDAGNA